MFNIISNGLDLFIAIRWHHKKFFYLNIECGLSAQGSLNFLVMMILI